jgi:hypothetical protein
VELPTCELVLDAPQKALPVKTLSSGEALTGKPGQADDAAKGSEPCDKQLAFVVGGRCREQTGGQEKNGVCEQEDGSDCPVSPFLGCGRESHSLIDR